jgi:hypothetical protein
MLHFAVSIGDTLDGICEGKLAAALKTIANTRNLESLSAVFHRDLAEHIGGDRMGSQLKRSQLQVRFLQLYAVLLLANLSHCRCSANAVAEYVM